jgi:hypothetical protein
VAAERRDTLGRRIAEPEVILPTLVEHGVDFLLIGGLAVIIHGNPRATFDVGILPSPDAANLRCLAAALGDLGAVATDDRARELPLPLDHPEGLAVGNYFLDTRAGALDLVNGSRPDLKRYRALAGRAVEVKIAGVPVRAIGRADLIAMKSEAGRDKDLRDIAALTEAERRRDELGD